MTNCNLPEGRFSSRSEPDLLSSPYFALSSVSISARNSGTSSTDESTTFLQEIADASANPIESDPLFGSPDATIGSPVLTYTGYLKHTTFLRQEDLDNLIENQVLSDATVDVLISHLHAQVAEANPDRAKTIIAFPTSFVRNLRALMGSAVSPSTADRSSRAAHEVVAGYDSDIWNSRIILVPATYGCHRALLVICNAYRASSKKHAPIQCQYILPGESRPDNYKFCVLAMNATGKTPERVTSAVMRFLDYHYRHKHDDELQYVERWHATCPFLVDEISGGLHTVHQAEVVLRDGVAETLRKSAQGVLKLKSRQVNDIFKPYYQNMYGYLEVKTKVILLEVAICSQLRAQLLRETEEQRSR